MPLEIRELVIKARVDGTSSATEDSKETTFGEVQINEIVDKVLEIIKNQSER